VWCFRGDKNVVLKQTLFDPTARELHPPYAVLDTIKPLAPVAAAVSPNHLSVSVSLVVFVTALILVPALPSKYAHSRFLVISIIPFIHVSSLVPLAPFAFPVLLTVFKLAGEGTQVFPFILAESMWLSKLVLASIYITHSKQISALAMLEAVLPLAFVSVSILPLVNAVSICFRLLPLANVRIPKNSFPNAMAFF
jgi:hypothetical protein